MRLILSFIIIIISGCSTTPVKLSYNCPKVVLPPDPILYIESINRKSSDSEIMKFWVATAEGYIEWNRSVREQIEDING